MRRSVVVAAALALAACGPHGTSPRPSAAMWPSIDEAFLTAYTETARFTLGTPVVLGVARDGTVVFRRTPPRNRVAELYALDPRTGEERLLASPAALLAGEGEELSDAEKARRERTRTSTRGVVDADLSLDGARVLVPLGERVFVVELAGGKALEVMVGDGFPYDPRLSPDGKTVSFVRDGDLWLVDTGAKDGVAGASVPMTGRSAPPRAAAGAPRQLTRGGGTGAVENGVAEFAAQEELGRTRGYWWSPDGTTILYQHTDASTVDTLYVADPRHPDRAPVPFRYPRAGRPNADVTLQLVAAAGGSPRQVEWDRTRWPYLADVVWDEDGPPTLVVLDRDQNEVAVLAVDAATGATRSLLVETDEAWINVPKGAPLWLPGGAGFLWMTEKPGNWVLEHRGPDGAVIAQLTEPAFGLRSIAGYDADGKAVWVVAGGETSVDDQVFTVPLAGGAPTKITSEPGVHAAVSQHGVSIVNSIGRDAPTPTWKVVSKTGEVPLRSVAEAPPYLPTTVLETVDAGGLSYPAAVTRPRAFDASRTYPVLVKVYGGPHSRTVLDTRRSYLLDQFYADAGFIVVRIDNRGIPGKGRSWERAILRDLATAAVADQAAALRVLGARHREMDMQRVGVFGWSFGGYMAAMLVMQHPELYRAGVAGAPVTDWQLYDTAYTERYMKQPAANVDGYARANVLTYADRLARPLLLIHGITDDNVHFAHTLALVEALYLAGKRAEVVTLSSTHMVPDPKLALAQEKLQLDFFRDHLAPP
jgi:dipeptidyl-peptidase-4